MTAPENMGAVILAAGSSSRLGRPKQLIEFKHKTLLQHVIDTINPFNFNPCVLVLGANAGQIRKMVKSKNMTVLNNKNWPEGIASSIRLGVSESIKLNKSLDSILFLLSDQPYISNQLIQELINRHMKENKPITACSYKKSIGVPVIFDKNYFPQLMGLAGDVGAKKIILQNHQDVGKVDFKKGYVDIDTVEDVEKLNNRLY